jgi:hypothetical protein
MRAQTRVTLDVKSRYVYPTLTETGMCPEVSVNLKTTITDKNVFSDYRVVICVQEHTLKSTLHWVILNLQRQPYLRKGLRDSIWVLSTRGYTCFRETDPLG